MIKQRDRKQQKENDVAVAGGSIKAAGAGGTAGFTPPAAISGVSLQPGFTIESEILSARVKEQEYAEYSKSLAEAAVQKERKGDFASSPTFWQEAQRMDSISQDYGAKASFYEQLRYTPAAAAAVMSTGGAPRSTVPGGQPATPIVQTTRSAQPRSFSGYDNTWVMPQTAPPTGDDQGVEDRVALDFDSASSTAKEAYEAYRAAQKEFDNEYGWQRNPTSHGGYGAAYGELQELKQAYLESLDFLLDNYDSFETDAGIPPPDRDRDTLQGYMNQLTEHMWDYYHEDPEDVDPERIAMYIADIAALRNAMETAPLQVVAEETPAWQEYMKKSLNQIIKGNYTDDVTLAGTLGQIGLGLLGADFLADLRDITYDWTHLKTTPWYQTLLDTIAIFPGIGAIRYWDEAVDTAKAANKAADTAEGAVDLTKQADELVDIDGDTTPKALDAIGNVEYSKISSLEITQNVSPKERGYSDLLADISENGIIEPIKYVRVGDTCYVVDGHHRLYAAKQLGFDTVPTEEVTLPYQGYKTIADLFWWD